MVVIDFLLYLFAKRANIPTVEGMKKHHAIMTWSSISPRFQSLKTNLGRLH